MTLWILWTVFASALVALSAAAAERALAFFGAARRHVWFAALGIAVLLPLPFAFRELPGPTAPSPASAAAASQIAHRAPPASVPRIAPRSLTVDAALMHRADRFAVDGWWALSLALLLVYGVQLVRLRRERARWTEARTDGCHVLVAHDAGPAVVGVLYPRIVIPEWVLSLDRDARRLLFQHELEHIAAGDPAALLMAGLLLVLFPWNPALWWMVRRLRLAIEIDCDARVIRSVGRAHDYGVMLLTVGERHARPLALVTSLIEPKLGLEARIAAMTEPARRRPARAALPFALGAFVALTGAARIPQPAPLRTPTPAARPVRTPGPNVDVPVGPAVERASLAGRVVTTEGMPVSEAAVGVVGSRLGTFTDANGAFRIDGVPLGTLGVVVHRAGFENLQPKLTIHAGGNTATFAIHRYLLRLQPIVVTMRSTTPSF